LPRGIVRASIELMPKTMVPLAGADEALLRGLIVSLR
jgi:hypothetical protein